MPKPAHPDQLFAFCVPCCFFRGWKNDFMLAVTSSCLEKAPAQRVTIDAALFCLSFLFFFFDSGACPVFNNEPLRAAARRW